MRHHVRPSSASLLVTMALALAHASPPHLSPRPLSLSLIDTHVHNSNLSRFGSNFYTYPASFPDLNRSFSMVDFAAALDPPLQPRPGVTAAVGGVILMELEKANNTFENGMAEAAFYQQTADACAADPPNCGGAAVLGLVASAPLEQGGAAVSTYIQQLLYGSIAGGGEGVEDIGGEGSSSSSSRSGSGGGVAPSLVGIRQGLWTAGEEALFDDPGFREGLAAVGAAGLAFDLLVEKDALPKAATLAAAVPGVRLNLNHLGYPDVGNATAFASWEADLTAFAAVREDVYCKLSGLPQAYGKPGWTAADFAPYVRAALTAFGPRRVNFAGNWFILTDDAWQGTYPSMLAAVLAALEAAGAPLASDDADWVLRKTAKEIYGV